jgi:hypothetical protein
MGSLEKGPAFWVLKKYNWLSKNPFLWMFLWVLIVFPKPNLFFAEKKLSLRRKSSRIWVGK